MTILAVGLGTSVAVANADNEPPKEQATGQSDLVQTWVTVKDVNSKYRNTD